MLELLKMESIPTRRYIKVRNGTNPFDPQWYSYFEKRKLGRVRRL